MYFVGYICRPHQRFADKYRIRANTRHAFDIGVRKDGAFGDDDIAMWDPRRKAFGRGKVNRKVSQVAIVDANDARGERVEQSERTGERKTYNFCPRISRMKTMDSRRLALFADELGLG